MASNRLYFHALSFLGTPYKFGGRNQLEGIDCSQLVIEILIGSGVLPHGYDNTAQGLYDHFKHLGPAPELDLGALAFFGQSLTEITHIGFCMDHYCMIEAGGGDSTTVNINVAIQKSALVRIRPIRYRKDYLCAIMPKYPNEF